MIRDTKHYYHHGKGYYVEKDGTTVEDYWRIDESTPVEKELLPYQIKMVGVTVDIDVAVQRGMVRKIVSGRGVPIPSQIRSHKLFSENFEKYCELVDEFTLYDNNRASEPYIIAERKIEGDFRKKEPEYSSFLMKKEANVNATNYLELYPSAIQVKEKVVDEKLKESLVEFLKMERLAQSQETNFDIKN